MSRSRLSLVLLAGLSLLALVHADAEVAGAAEILAKVDSFRLYAARGYSYDFATSESDGTESLMRVAVSLGDGESALVRYLEPLKERGRAVLVRGSSFWLFESGMKSALRISPRQMLSGQAAAGDVSRIAFGPMYEIVSRGQTDSGFLLSLKAKPKAGATYDQVELETDLAYRPTRARCKGASGLLMKTIDYDGYALIGGKDLLVGFSIADAIGKTVTRIRLSNFSPELPPESAFSVQALRYAQ
jgi:hypothetical protein